MICIVSICNNVRIVASGASVQENRILICQASRKWSAFCRAAIRPPRHLCPFSARRPGLPVIKPPLIRHLWGSSSPLGLSDDPKKQWLIHPDMELHTRAGLSSLAEDDQRDTGFSVYFLGTGAGRPSLLHGNAATALRLSNGTYLFDAGEGVQHRIMMSRIKVSDIRKIFITHLHADHILGLTGVLLEMQMVAKQSSTKAKRQIQIYGPVGLYSFIAATLSLSYTELKYLSVEVFELCGGSPRRLPLAMRQFGEVRQQGLYRKAIPQNEDGTWTIEIATEITTAKEAMAYNSRPRGMYVTAAELEHLPKLHCFGYVVREPLSQPRNIDETKAIEAGLRPSKKYQALKSGFSVPNDDGTAEIQPDDVLIGDAPAPRSVAILGDCSSVPSPMAELCRDVDVLVHEATIHETDKSSAKIDWGGHSDAGTAGAFANRVKAKVLVLNHLSATARILASERAMAREAERQIEGPTRVQIAYDHLELLVPRFGFPW